MIKFLLQNSLERFSGFRGTNFTKRREDIHVGLSWLHTKFVSEFGYLAAFSKAAAQISVMLKTTPNSALFDPPVKIRGGWARSLYQLLKLYLRSKVRNTFDGHPLRGCW